MESDRETPQNVPPMPQRQEDKFHRQISAGEKMSAVLSVLKGLKTVEQLCRDLNITKEAYYQWQRTCLASMREALEPAGRGRKPQKPQEPPELKDLKKENRKLAREKESLEAQVRIIRRIIRWQRDESPGGGKKNGT
jgi:transposase-like protein